MFLHVGCSACSLRPGYIIVQKWLRTPPVYGKNTVGTNSNLNAQYWRTIYIIKKLVSKVTHNLMSQQKCCYHVALFFLARNAWFLF